jgi:hypothetical protein
MTYRAAYDRSSLLISTGLKMLGATSTSLEEAWKQIFPTTIPYDSKNSDLNLRVLLFRLSKYTPEIQKQQILEDLDEAICLLRLNDPHKPFPLPILKHQSADNRICAQLVKNIIDVSPSSFILEDGSGSGANLLVLGESRSDKNRSFKAVGTDIDPKQATFAQILTHAVGLQNVYSFAPAHALHRFSPRYMAEKQNKKYDQYIIVACRVIPVLTENKIQRYLEKLGNEMQPGDLWCGSIALPEGPENGYYNRNVNDKEAIRRLGIQRIEMSCGGETFVHTPEGLRDPKYLDHFKREAGKLNIQDSSQDIDKAVNNVILNTYMTQDQFATLASKHGLHLATKVKVNSQIAREPETHYSCIVLEKK